jgi:glutamate formiminotransferase
MLGCMDDDDALFGVVPNFSEGRRTDVIDAIVRALHVPGARVVHAEADPDHNRLDTTVLGRADAVQASAIAGAAIAVDRIDMREHAGGHPRMGAADVIPFMPVRGVTIERCIELARSFGRELAERLDLPVYLYDRAALVPERASLADVRRGEFEGLREAVERGERLPDFGPNRIGPAGATAVGARVPLVAFNVYLDGTDEAAAKAIAKQLRASSGGLPAVRAIGFAVPERGGIVTVSMNLVDHEVTGLRTAFARVEELAAGYGMRVRDAEIVGLVPAAALAEGDIDALRLRGFDPARQVLEQLVDDENEEQMR